MLSSMERVIQLKKIPLFSGLQAKELAAIGAIVKERAFAAGGVIIQEGAPGDSLFLVLRGRVKVIKAMDSANPIQLAEIGPEEWFGEMALFDRQPRSASVVACEDTQLLELGRFEFEEIMREFPSIAIHACQVFTRRLRELQEKLGWLKEKSPKNGSVLFSVQASQAKAPD
ncbi:MAG: cyclic nucleotide-binding domain-containing protein [bacterium]